MATTQTLTEAPFESISLDDRNRNHHATERQENVRGRRVFEADPAFTITLATRRMIIALLVCANTIQVSHPFIQRRQDMTNIY